MRKLTYKLMYLNGLMTFVISIICLSVSLSLPDSFDKYKGEKLIIDAPVSVTAEINENADICKTQVKALGFIPIKTVTINNYDRPYLIPCGTPFGIKMTSDGAMVTSYGNINGVSPAAKAGIETGDIIKTVNGVKITNSETIADAVNESNGNIIVEYERDGKEFTAEIKPETDENGKKRIGLWVRDSTAGIGTMTYINPDDNTCGGLGHAVCDIDTGKILPLYKGTLVPVTINNINKSLSGCPGELCGTFDNSDSLGIIKSNTEKGLFGEIKAKTDYSRKIPIAYKDEVICGNAEILTTTSGSKPEAYSIVIEKTDKNSSGKNMVIRITDKKLLEKTGGIVQGMSGSPIIQQNRIVGAITHVFINDPTRGYGIFISDMLEKQRNCE